MQDTQTAANDYHTTAKASVHGFGGVNDAGDRFNESALFET
jgi:hypothetical protein